MYIHERGREREYRSCVIITKAMHALSIHMICTLLHDSSRLSLIWMGLNIHSCLC